jgi:hypothetical protein
MNNENQLNENKEKEVKELVWDMEWIVKGHINEVLENYISGGDLDSDLWDSLTDENKKSIGEICLMNEDGEEDTFNEILYTIQETIYRPIEFDTEIEELLKRLV